MSTGLPMTLHSLEPARGSSSEQVLIAEDETMFRRTVESRLERANNAERNRVTILSSVPMSK